MQITLELFGAFRPFGEKLELSLPDHGTVADIPAALQAEINAQPGLIQSSRFATETEILPQHAALKDGMTLAILPPVSGG